jgi:tetratricopeptide (TPR) repeat protein
MKITSCMYTGMRMAIVLAMLTAACSTKERQLSFQAPLFDNMGDYHLPVTAQSPDAGRFVTQGILLANAFNHMEAARSFREAIRLDSTCALAYWGLAYVLGPNYNAGTNLGETEEIRYAMQKALQYASGAQGWEQALIHALSTKFPEEGEPDETVYAQHMEQAYTAFPQNDFIVTLYAEALMNLHAWDLYTRKGGEPKPWTSQIVSVIEKALVLNPLNPLANHLYIHATEGAPDVEKALPSAERLASLVPGAGHLVHMPSHIYINTGDYYLGSLANERAVTIDSAYIAQCQVTGVYPQLYFPHNWHFLSATAAFEGRGAKSVEAAFQTAAIIDRYYLREPGFETTQHYVTIPYHVLVKFAQWEKIMVLPAPDEDLIYPAAIWHYARGMAYANSGKLTNAKEELAIVQKLTASDDVKNTLIWEINSAVNICTIAFHVLAGEIDRLEGRTQQAINHFEAGIAIEDQLNYNEPPDWFFSVRHYLGELLLENGQPALAEAVYREDLSYWVKNGFALNGLYHSLHMQQKHTEAADVQQQFFTAWQRADVDLKYSRLDAEKRQYLAIAIRDNTPPNLVYLAGALCYK